MIERTRKETRAYNRGYQDGCHDTVKQLRTALAITFERIESLEADLKQQPASPELQRVWNTPEAREYIDGLRGDPDSRETLPDVRATQPTLPDGEFSK